MNESVNELCIEMINVLRNKQSSGGSGEQTGTWFTEWIGGWICEQIYKMNEQVNSETSPQWMYL